MLSINLFFIACLLCSSALSAPTGNNGGRSYQYVKFLSSGIKSHQSGGTDGFKQFKTRSSRSFSFDHDLLAASVFDHDLILPNEWIRSSPGEAVSPSLDFEFNRGHVTPDFSNGLEYPDPYLLTGHEAKKAADFLYRKPLFFGEVNHIKLMQYNQDLRRKNGLAGHKLGSLRPHLPWYRYKHSEISANHFL